MQLALGTVQFGLGYGVAGRATPVPATEVRAILQRAHALGIDLLDTAASYGNIEARLSELMPDAAFGVVTKLPPRADDITLGEFTWIDDALASAEQRLGTSIVGLMFHRAEDLLDEIGAELWQRCAAWTEARGVKLGVSVYGPPMLERLCRRFPVAIAQLPGNALDQRLRQVTAGVEIHLRSAFLQGLLLMPLAQAQARVPQAAAALSRWHRWLADEQLEPLGAALGIVKGLPGVQRCVVGVDSLAQLEAIAEAWTQARPLQAPALAEQDPRVIDPRQWPARA